MQTPIKKQPKSIRQIIKDLILKEVEMESKKKINIIIIPTRIGQSCWGTRNLRRISPSNHQKIEQGAIVSPINCSQISPMNQSQGSPSNYRIKNTSKYGKLLKMNNQEQPYQASKKKQKYKTEPRQKSQSVNTAKPFHQRLPSLPRRINYFADEAKSLQLKLTDTIEGYRVQQDDMSLEIDEYVKMNYINQFKHQEN